MIDETSKSGARAAERLRNELILWLTTVSPDGQPQTSPVWFLWDGADEIWMLSKDETPRVRNLDANPRVALSLDGNGQGGDIVSLEGEARVAERVTPLDHVPGAYLEKYGAKLAEYNWTMAGMLVDYPVTLRIAIRRARTW
jgi:PPOX class probable F420-dependent enzyme